MKMHIRQISNIIRIFVGLVFITSAILKYVSIDVFDLYVYEHNLFSISVTETLTRLLIMAEAVLGFMLIINLYARPVYYIVWFLLTCFTLYLLMLPVLFDVNITNCHCFGEAIVLTRTQSVIKNGALMLCLLFVSPRFYTRRKWEIQLTTVLCVAIFATVIVANAPDYLYTAIHREKVQIDNSMIEMALFNSGKQKEFTDGKQIICMYTVFCKFCRRSAYKLNLILKNNNLYDDNIKAIFWSDTPEDSIHEFFSEQNLFTLQYITFSVDTFLSITDGRIPVFLFVDDGKIVHKAHYVTLSERKVVDFLRKNNDESE